VSGGREGSAEMTSINKNGQEEQPPHGRGAVRWLVAANVGEGSGG